MELPIHKFQLIKTAVHVAQLVLTLMAFIVCILVFKSKAETGGRLGWYFGLCFLTAIPIIYLTMTPRFPRTRRFASPIAMLVVDALFALLWLTAFASAASLSSSSNKCKDACGKTKGLVGLGVFIWLLFCLTTAMSTYALLFHRREGYLPGASRAPTNAAMIDPDKEAFSTAPGVDEYAPVHGQEDHDKFQDHDGDHDHDDHTAGAGRYNADSYGRSGSGGYMPPPLRVNDVDTGYTGYTGMGGMGGSPQIGGGGSGEYGRTNTQFPGGNYGA